MGELIDKVLSGLSFEKALPRMIHIKGGEFIMGSEDEIAYDSEKPEHKVQIDSFYLGESLLSQSLWEAIMSNNPSSFKGDDRPVENISWNDIQSFLDKINTLTGKKFRLPTEAEWEFAAKGGIISEGYIYAGSDRLKEVGWFRGNSNNQTHPICQKPANELGLFDMSGNVWEWCQDWYSMNYYQSCFKQGLTINPNGVEDGDRRVLRGGSWIFGSRNCRISYRYYASPEYRGSDFGFRLAMSL